MVSSVSILFALLAQHVLCYFALDHYFTMTLGAARGDLMVKPGFLLAWYYPSLPYELDFILDDCNDLSINLLKP